MTDEEIVERIIGGNAGLFAVLIARHHQRILRVVRGIVHDRNEVDDIVQQIYLNAYAHLNQFAGKSRFSTWLLRIAIHQALSRAREEYAAAKETSSLETANEVIDQRSSAELSPEQLAFNHELQQLIEREVLALPVLYRAVLVLRDVDGLTTEESAECLGVSLAVVRTRLRRGRAMLRERLSKKVGISLDSLFRFLGGRCDQVVSTVQQRIGTAN